MKTPNIEKAVQLYFAKAELTNADIISLFGCGQTKAVKLKKAVKEEMAKRGLKSWLPHSIKTTVAYEVWGMDINDLQERLKNLRRLKLT